MRPYARDGSPEQLFRVLDRTHHIAIDTLLSKRGLSGIGQPIILIILARQEAGTIASQKELAKRLNVSPATVTVSLKSMERDGYIKKLNSPMDLRRKPICITEKGMEAAEQIDQVFELLDHSMYLDFSPAEKSHVAALYRRMIDNLRKVVAEETQGGDRL